MINTKMKLPIKISNIECVTECWTFNRMIILNQSPYYKDWIASHYNLYVDRGEFHFEQMVCTPALYDSILQRKQIRYFELTEAEIINRFKLELNKGYYLNVMTKPFIEKDWYHEVVLYGYDDIEQIFYAVGFDGYGFKEMQYSYQFMIDMLKEVKSFLKVEKRQRGMRLAELFQYPISAFKLREDYNPQGCVFGAFHKIKMELNGKCYGVGKRSLDEWTYTGISSLKALEDLLDEMIEERMVSRTQKVESVLKILCEHRRMMLISMEYVQDKWRKALKKEFFDNVVEYRRSCETVEKWLNMIIKYKLNNCKDILREIHDEISGIYQLEYRCLDNIVKRCIDWDKFNEYYI